MAFEAGPSNPAPFSVALTPAFDLIDILPVGAADRLRALRQHVSDRHALLPMFGDIQEISNAKLLAERQLQRLLAPRSESGFNLDPTDNRVVFAEEHLAKLTADAQRLKELDEVRSGVWRSASATLVNVEQWLRGGRPAGTVLADFDGPEAKLPKGENITDAIERLRRRGRELKADLHRIRSAPFPSSYAKAQMRAQIDALAQQGVPDVADLIEHDRRIIFPSHQVQSSVINAQTPALAFVEVDASIPFVIWLHREALIKKLDAEIDSEADDNSALTHDARKQQETVALGDLLSTERDESALVWRAMSERLPVDHRSDCAPQAILGCMIVTAPKHTNGGGYVEHAGGGR